MRLVTRLTDALSRAQDAFPVHAGAREPGRRGARVGVAGADGLLHRFRKGAAAVTQPHCSVDTRLLSTPGSAADGCPAARACWWPQVQVCFLEHPALERPGSTSTASPSIFIMRGGRRKSFRKPGIATPSSGCWCMSACDGRTLSRKNIPWVKGTNSQLNANLYKESLL